MTVVQPSSDPQYVSSVLETNANNAHKWTANSAIYQNASDVMYSILLVKECNCQRADASAELTPEKAYFYSPEEHFRFFRGELQQVPETKL
ncbi:hypothetical protein Aduo_015662 [Ancylostoma duodenale]